jgi:hypothetical protein
MSGAKAPDMLLEPILLLPFFLSFPQEHFS